jgi:hypothetical protein
MKIHGDIGKEVDLLRRWVLASGRDVLATTRDSFMSMEGRAGVSVFVALWVLERWTGGSWNIWGREMGGEILPMVRLWYPGTMLLVQLFLLGAHLLVGALWGILVKNAWGWLGFLWPKTVAERFRPWVVGTTTGLIVFCAHSGLLLRDLARHPALYQETFLDRGGFSAWVQRISVTALPGIGGTVVLLLVGVLAGAAIVRLIQRMVFWFLNFPRPTRMAMAVLGGGLALFACGLQFVVWTQAGKNVGPNLLLISVDGLRANRGIMDQGEEPSPFSSLVRRACVNGRAIPPSSDFSPAFATAFLGRSPLSHGIRHDFPAEADLSGDLNSLPAFLRTKGWTTMLLADGPESFPDRIRNEFDRAHVASSAFPLRLTRRQMERSPHLLPYLSGRFGRWVSPLRGSPFLADPAILAREAVGAVADLQQEPKFFLWVHFSVLKPLSAICSPRVAARVGRENASFYRRPGDGRTERLLTEVEWDLLGKVYDENRVDLREALETLMKDLVNRGLDGNTAVILWSPRATPLSEHEEEEALNLKGPAFFDVPFLAVPPSSSKKGGRYMGLGRTLDVAPTAVGLLGLSAPAEWEGSPLMEGIPEGEGGIYYSETATPFVQTKRTSRIPPLIHLLKEDREAPGHLRLDPAWEDPVLMFRDRAIQIGEERLRYHPGETGVSFEFTKRNEDPIFLKKFAVARSRIARPKDLRDVFYRYLSRESEWRPQNDFWIPEAFLREKSGEDIHGD